MYSLEETKAYKGGVPKGTWQTIVPWQEWWKSESTTIQTTRRPSKYDTFGEET